MTPRPIGPRIVRAFTAVFQLRGASPAPPVLAGVDVNGLARSAASSTARRARGRV